MTSIGDSMLTDGGKPEMFKETKGELVMNGNSRRRSKLFTALAAMGLLLNAGHSHAGLVGAPFQVNASSSATLLTVNAAPNGETSPLFSSSTPSFIRRYSANGVDLTGGDYFVGISAGSVAFSRNGNYAVVRTAADGSGQGIYASVYNRAGGVVVSEFRVNSVTAGDQTGPLVVTDQSSGSFAVSWMQGSPTRIYTKRFNAGGGVTLADTDVTAGLSGNALLNTMAMDAAGNYVIGWLLNPGTTADAVDVWVRRYPAVGGASAAIRASVTTTNVQDGINVAMNASGDTVVAWQSYLQDGSENGVYARRFSSTLSPLGSEFRINTTVAGNQTVPKAGVADDGSFLISWMSDNRVSVPSSIPAIGLQQYYADGTPYGAEFFVGPVAGTITTYPSVAVDPAGNALLAWRGYSGGINQVYAQRLTLDTLPPVNPISNGQTVPGLAGGTGSFQHYRLFIPAGTTTANVNLTGPSGGDANLYIRAGAQSTLARWDIRPQIFGNNEGITINNPPAGELYISVYAQDAYSGVSLSVSTQ